MSLIESASKGFAVQGKHLFGQNVRENSKPLGHAFQEDLGIQPLQDPLEGRGTGSAMRDWIELLDPISFLTGELLQLLVVFEATEGADQDYQEDDVEGVEFGSIDARVPDVAEGDLN